nr:hypothetical protein [Desulfobacula sp.]
RSFRVIRKVKAGTGPGFTRNMAGSGPSAKKGGGPGGRGLHGTERSGPGRGPACLDAAEILARRIVDVAKGVKPL